jgi:cell division protein FtsQ
MKIGLSYGKVRKIFMMVLWIVVAGGCAFLLVAAIRRQNRALCKGVRITIEGRGKWMVDSADIQALLTDQHTRQLVGTPAENISIKRLEKKINSSPWVRSAQLFFDSKQVLWARVTEREPVARVFTNEGNSFYVDTSGARLPLRDYYPTRLPVFTSCPLDSKHYTQADTLLIRQIGVLSAYLNAHPFWMNMVEQVDMTQDGSFELVPAIGDEVVKLGDTSALDNKFHRLWIFYKNVSPKIGWNKYAALDVRFDGEVIGVKKESGAEPIDTAAASAMLRKLLDQSKTAMQDTVVRNVEPGRNFLVPDIDSSRDLTSLGGESAAPSTGPMLGQGVHMGTTTFATSHRHKGAAKGVKPRAGSPKAVMPAKGNKKK